MIRLANYNDIKSINELGKLVNNNFCNTYDIKDYIFNDKYIMLVNDENIVNAMLIAYDNIDYLELEMIVVNILNRRNGIGNKMMDYLINNYGKNKKILLEVASNNESAINLYKKFNFKIISVRKKYYGNVDAYIMERNVV